MRSVSFVQSSRNSNTDSRHFALNSAMPYSSICCLVLDAELLLDGDLDRQAVAVPAALAVGVEPAHRLVAREDVLEDAGQDVVGAGPAVGGRRALVEDVRRRALAALEGLVVDVQLAPALEDLLLELREGDVLGQGTMRRHWCRSLGGTVGSNPCAWDEVLAAVAAGLVFFLLLLGGIVFFTRDEDNIQADNILAENFTLAVNAGGRRSDGTRRPARRSRLPVGPRAARPAGDAARRDLATGSGTSGRGSTPSTAAIC